MVFKLWLWLCSHYYFMSLVIASFYPLSLCFVRRHISNLQSLYEFLFEGVCPHFFQVGEIQHEWLQELFKVSLLN